MKSAIHKAILGAMITATPGLALAHHGESEELAAQVLHATVDPWHLGVSLLVVAALAMIARFVRSLRKVK